MGGMTDATAPRRGGGDRADLDTVRRVVRDALDGRATEDEAVARIRAICGEGVR